MIITMPADTPDGRRVAQDILREHHASRMRYYSGSTFEALDWGRHAESPIRSYANPDPPGYPQHPGGTGRCRWDDYLAEFVLPYELVRTAPDPDARCWRSGLKPGLRCCSGQHYARCSVSEQSPHQR